MGRLGNLMLWKACRTFRDNAPAHMAERWPDVSWEVLDVPGALPELMRGDGLSLTTEQARAAAAYRFGVLALPRLLGGDVGGRSAHE